MKKILKLFCAVLFFTTYVMSMDNDQNITPIHPNQALPKNFFAFTIAGPDENPEAQYKGIYAVFYKSYLSTTDDNGHDYCRFALFRYSITDECSQDTKINRKQFHLYDQFDNTSYKLSAANGLLLNKISHFNAEYNNHVVLQNEVLRGNFQAAPNLLFINTPQNEQLSFDSTIPVTIGAFDIYEVTMRKIRALNCHFLHPNQDYIRCLLRGHIEDYFRSNTDS